MSDDAPVDDALDDTLDDPLDDTAGAVRDAAFIADHEARLAEARASAIAAGRRKAGLAGAAMAGAMLAVAEIYEGPRKDQDVVVVDAASDPNDLDADGIDVTVGDTAVSAPALERLAPVSRNGRKPPVV